MLVSFLPRANGSYRSAHKVSICTLPMQLVASSITTTLMGSAHSAGHALVILVWSLAGRGEASPLEVEVRSGPKGLWAKLDD